MENKLKQETLEPRGKYWIPHNLIMKLTQHPTIKNQLYFNILYILQRDKSVQVCDLISTISRFPINWYM